MATRASRPPATADHPHPKHSKLVRCIALILLALIVLVGLVVLIIWLAVKPRRLIYTMEDGSINGFNLSNSNHLDANFGFVLRFYNPNHKVSIYYDSILVSVSYHDETLASNVVEPFYQRHRNVTRLNVKAVAKSVPLLGPVAKDLRREKSMGGIELDVHVKARIRFKVGLVKSNHRTLKVLCSPVVHFSSSKGFERVYCDFE